MNFVRVCICITLGASLIYSFNHPEISWKSVTTKHFVINYYDHTESAVYATWKIAEEAFGTLSSLYDYQPKDKISISLADYDDYSNGSADWMSGSIIIWVPDSRFELRGNTVWLRNVITHELAHIISLEKRRKKQFYDIFFNLQLTTPDETYDIAAPFPMMTLFPSWFAEGIAQRESERQGNDCWDSRRDMALRCAVLDKKTLSLDEMGYFNHNSMGNEMVYNQGFSLIKFIERKIGSEDLFSVFKTGSSESAPFQRLFLSKTGHSLDQFYREWLDSLTQAYNHMVPPNQTSVVEIYGKGTNNTVPKVSSDGQFWGWLTDDRDDGGRTDLVIAHRGEKIPIIRIPYALSSWCFVPGKQMVYFIKARTPDKHGSFLNDLYSFDLDGKKEERLTSGARLYDISAAPDGRSYACVFYKDGMYAIKLFDPQTRSFTETINAGIGNPVMNVCFNQDASELAFTQVIDGKSKLFKLSLKDGRAEALTNFIAQEESPYWSQSGRIYFNADYDGIFNVYSIKPDGSDLRRHTHVTGGAFSPTTLPDGEIICSLYGSSGFKIAQVTPVSDSISVVENSGCSFRELPAPPGPVTIKYNPYQSKLLRSTYEIQLMGNIVKNSSVLSNQVKADQDLTQISIGGMFLKHQSDALSKRTRTLGAGIGAAGSSQTDNQSSSLNENQIQKLLSQNDELQINGSSVFSKSYERKQYGKLLFPKTSGLLYDHMQQSEEDSSENNEKIAVMPYLIGNLGFKNSSSAAVRETQFQMQIPFVLPQAFLLNGTFNSQWQLTRDLYAGFSTEYVFCPYYGSIYNTMFYGSIPVSITWSRTGYYNKDIDYNNGDLTQCSFIIGPRYIPELIKDEYGDTDIVVPWGLMTGLDLFHGISVMRYGSIQLFSSNMVVCNNQKILDEMQILEGDSRTYFSSQTGIKAAFPLVRNINKKTLHYLDALYGSIGYDFSARAKKEFFKSATRNALFDPDFNDSTIQVGHIITAGLELGYYKDYTFFGKLNIEFDYELLRKQFYLNITTGF